MSGDLKPAGVTTRCRGCKQPIVWVVTESGSKMPVNATPGPDGRFFGFVVGGRFGRIEVEHVGSPSRRVRQARLDRDRNRYTSHFATCPQAGKHRRKR